MINREPIELKIVVESSCASINRHSHGVHLYVSSINGTIFQSDYY